jgi:deazaflavin-dependent oxidoreductase (nitroreductase family)
VTPSGPRNGHDRWRPLRRIGRPVEALQIRWLGRSLVAVAARTPVLVLHTTGRRSGTERATPLAFHREPDGALLVVGGAGGQARLPDWVANLRADQRGAVTVQRRRVEVLAQEITGEERAELWSALALRWPRIETYQRRAGRPVPVFRLVPVR